ncbi:MAG: hypothetical protein VCB43_16050, partial [Myxococcota bacterium]
SKPVERGELLQLLRAPCTEQLTVTRREALSILDPHFAFGRDESTFCELCTRLVIEPAVF